MPRRRLALWCWWIPVVWAISFPWSVTSTPQWQRVHWLPFADPADQPRDLVANVVLFVPFGYSFARGRRGARILKTLLAAGLVSVSAEALQLFGTSRYPSATDVTAALAGSAAGAWLGIRGRQGRKMSERGTLPRHG